MLIKFILLSTILLINYVKCEELPTLYEYYTSGGIKSGLKADGQYFTLNGKKITLLSGSLHYFRVPREYWKDRLIKYKAAGLNAVQFYTPWNLHEETPGNWDFKSPMLDLAAFLKDIKDADMLAVIRPGPYICAEWEMGGYPAWLLRDPTMRVRSNYKPYLEAAGKYLNAIMNITNQYLFTKGGPVVMLQLENEFNFNMENAAQKEYFNYLHDTVTKSGFEGVLFTSDPGGNAQKNPMRNTEGMLETANLNTNAYNTLTELRKNQPNKPLYISEFWPGWFDNWGDNHHTYSVSKFETEVGDTLFRANASINFYMFHGGTNFGFTNGGQVVTSYDYDAPISESGELKPKYHKTKELIDKLKKERGEPNVKLPPIPTVPTPAAYGSVKVSGYLLYNDFLNKVKAIASDKPKPMELINVGSNYGQHFGFILYRANVTKFSKLTIKGGVNDRAVVAIDEHEVSTVEQHTDYTFTANASQFTASGDSHILDILVENTGRPNGGNEMNTARKGLSGDVLIDDKAHTGWQLYPLDFKEDFVKSLSTEKWKSYENVKTPAIYKAELEIMGEPKDTFLKLTGWTKGNAFVNGFNLGRYWSKGPQRTLYVPAPRLKNGTNEIYIFELHTSANAVEFVSAPIL